MSFLSGTTHHKAGTPGFRFRAVPVRGLSGARRHPALILFLSGMTGNVRQWSEVTDRLVDVPADLAFGTPVVPGVVFGRGVPTLAEMATAIANQLRSGPEGEVIIVSHSVGSFSALAIAHEIPAAVKSVILVNGGLASVGRFLDRPTREFAARPSRCLTYLRLFALVSAPAPQWLRRVLASRRWLTRAVLGDFVSASALQTQERRAAVLDEAGGPWVLASLWRNRHHWREFAAYAGQIRTDALFIVGDADPIGTEEDADEMAGMLPDATIRVLQGVGHAAPLEVPDVIAAAVRDALKA